jgi:sortase B
MNIKALARSNKKGYNVLLVLALLCFSLGLYLVLNFYFSSYLEEKKEDNLKSEIMKLATKGESKVKSINTENNINKEIQSYPAKKTVTPIQKTEIHPENLLPLNKETVGWIKIDKTPIDYPIFQHKDNEYYLKKNAYGNYSRYGSIFEDYRSKMDVSCKNIIIYGHNMRNEAMFGCIKNYVNESFFKSHNIININDTKKDTKWKVFSVYLLNSDKETIAITFKDEQKFLDIATGYLERSLVKTDTKLKGTDRLLTLITCTDASNEDRVVVHAKLIN